MNIHEQYNDIKSRLPEHVQLVAVSKTHPASAIQEVYDLGQRIFGENKVQEMTEKSPLLPKDIQWHIIGHLQTNKVKYIAGFVDTIQSVDSEKLIREIDKEAAKHSRIIKVLLQVKIAEEESKFGLEPEQAKEIFRKYINGDFTNIEITGLMGMATFTEDQDQVKNEFLILKHLFDELNKLKPLQTLSMGMSDDFPLAIECGANSIRVGSAIFGRRDYSK
ncbi:YggS family pyridoxal phosphate-dependent enzyme [Chryseobacterium sp. SSA4.19]|uniref:YggS family pyridoxal phosphate-dependent enzyme n=1 Tax=Chryseobacterium sp. SSA4.19 TaxID=2919915 RepID=UPI001F4DBFBB|nr:YggS family pyridoxal phosphate-dependent enzyme [Chryseobacterium sp. SSA4.19]MCJ8154312.1 YggS family pyridoxal phosphate-dependent enzyme [Chryseobacterium sp. SSA4.19]